MIEFVPRHGSLVPVEYTEVAGCPAPSGAHCWHRPSVETVFAIRNPPRSQFCCWCKKKRTLVFKYQRDPAHGPYHEVDGHYVPEVES